MDLFLLISYGEKKISSGLTGIINGSVPIFTAVLAHHFLPNDKISLGKTLGISSGMIGLLVIFAPTIFGEQLGSALGMGMVVIASIFYAMGMIYMKKHLQNLPPLIGPTGQLFFTSLVLLPATLILHISSPMSLPSWQVVGSIIGLGFLGTFLAFILYYKILQIASATELSYSALIFPV
ncbi:MAG: DMT family transporter, partial [Simkania negevensis]|nr:DMT family transporter [Simkania negevensis]